MTSNTMLDHTKLLTSIKHGHSLKNFYEPDCACTVAFVPSLNVLYLLTGVSNRCEKCLIFLSFSVSVDSYKPYCAVAMVKFDILHVENIRGRNIKSHLENFA